MSMCNACKSKEYDLFIPSLKNGLSRFCDECSEMFFVSPRHQLCLICKNGNLEEAVWCKGKLAFYPCFHRVEDPHLVYMCSNTDCEATIAMPA